jgi:predicted ATPase
MSCPSNLHRQPTAFVGRTADLVALAETVHASRVATVLGPPGVGKTRLAHRFAEEARDAGQYVGGVWWCDVSGTSNAAALGGVVRSAMGRPSPEGSGDPLHLGLEAPTLVVLDEGDAVVTLLVEALSRWLATEPAMRWIVTSRRRIDVAGEHCFDLLPLPVSSDPESDAARLFVARARAVDRGFSSCGEEEALSRLLARLDGLPLAIELAAARLRVLSLKQLDHALSADLSLLGAGHPLERAIAASWAPLDDDQRDVLAQCAVFHGGFELEDAAAVVERSPAAPPLASVLGSLSDCSLLGAITRDGRKRFELLATIRAFVIANAPRDVVARAEVRHRGHFVASGRAWRHDEDREAIRREQANLVAVHRSAFAVEAFDEALEAAMALSALASTLGYGWCDALLTHALERVDPREGAAALEVRGTLRRFLGRPDESEADLRACLALAEAAGDDALAARALSGLGNGAAARARWGEARGLLEQALARHAGARHAGRMRTMIAATWFNEDALDEAAATLEEALVALREAGDHHFEAISTASLGFVELGRGRLAAARTHLEEAQRTLMALGDRHWAAVAQGYLGWVAHAQGHEADGIARLDAAIAELERLGVRRAQAVALGQRGVLRLGADPEAAVDDLYAALRLHREYSPDLVGSIFGWLALAAARRGEIASAEAHLERADQALAPHRRPGSAAAVAAIRQTVLLTRARLAVEAGVEPPATGPLPTTGAGVSGADLRLALGFVEEARDALERARERARRGLVASALVVEAEGRWFRLPGAEHEVSLRRRRALGQILAALAEARHREPGAAVPIDALVRAGWPAERVLAKAGIDRVYNAVATLRRMGLRDALIRRDEGYLIDPQANFVLARVPDLSGDR